MSSQPKADNLRRLESFCYCSTLNFGIPPALVFQLEVYYKLDRLLTGLTAQQIGTTARWHSNKTYLGATVLLHDPEIIKDILNLFIKQG